MMYMSEETEQYEPEGEMVDEDNHAVYGRGGSLRRTQTPRQIGVKKAPHNIPKGGTTISRRNPEGKGNLFTGDYDQGKGSKAARRAAALQANKPKPKENKFSNRLTRSDRQGIHDSYDIFDTILDYLISEGYADTNENALVIMSNMSEEWRESIVEAVYGARQSPTDTPADTKKTMVVTAADKRGNTKAWQNYQAGNPNYSAAAHLQGV